MTLQRLLKAYEAVLPRHGVRPEQDVYYYRWPLCRLRMLRRLWWWVSGCPASVCLIDLGAVTARDPQVPAQAEPGPQP